jgi:hypothetical protein
MSMPPRHCAAGWRWAPWGWVLLSIACACGRPSVPSLSAADFVAPALSGLEPRVLELQVTDERPIAVEDRRATEDHLRLVLGELLESAGVSLAPTAPHALSIVVRLPSALVVGAEPAPCVEIQGQLRLSDGAETKTTTVGCAAWLMGNGAVFASVTAAFRRAMQGQLGGLDTSVGRAARVEKPLRFDPAAIDVPAFRWLTPRVVALEVNDEANLAGASGSGLRGAVEAAFARSDLQVDARARYRLVLALHRPSDEKAGARRCVELSAELSAPGEALAATRRECPPEGAGAGSRLLSSVLRGLDEQRAKVQRAKVQRATMQRANVRRAAAGG